MESPSALSPCINSRGKLLDVYVSAAEEAAKRCDAVFDADTSVKELQSALFDLLESGDEYWNVIEEKKGNQREAAEKLRDAIKAMKANLTSQEKAVDVLEKAAHKATRALEVYAKSVAGLRQHVVEVGDGLHERVSIMEESVPELLKKKKKRHVVEEVPSSAMEAALEKAARRGAEHALASREKSPRRSSKSG